MKESQSMCKYNYYLIIAYEGTQYYGWQDNHREKTVESELKKALQTILQKKIFLQAASRTDRGVHALGQVVNFRSDRILDKKKALSSLNGLLPKDIRVVKFGKAKDDFHPTLDVIEKEYCYKVCVAKIFNPLDRLDTWHCPYSIDKQLLIASAQKLEGTHNFAAFCNPKKTHRYHDYTRTIDSIDIQSLGKNSLRFSIRGNSFLYKMVRIVVGTILYVGAKKIDIALLGNILKSRDRSFAGMTAPAHGLCLHKVKYKYKFEVES